MQFFASISISRSIPKIIFLSLSALFLSCESAHPMNFLFGNKNTKKWVKGETYKVCDELLKKEDYKVLFEELNYHIYEEKSKYAQRWLKAKAKEGHVPLQYFYVSYLAQRSKDTIGEKVAKKALTYIIMSLMRAFQDLDWLSKTSCNEEFIGLALGTINKMKQDYADLWGNYIKLFGFDYKSLCTLALENIGKITFENEAAFISPLWICCTSLESKKIEFISLLLKRRLAMMGSKDIDVINKFRSLRADVMRSEFEKSNTRWDELFAEIK